jgi:hypothetical protein
VIWQYGRTLSHLGLSIDDARPQCDRTLRARIGGSPLVCAEDGLSSTRTVAIDPEPMPSAEITSYKPTYQD